MEEINETDLIEDKFTYKIFPEIVSLLNYDVMRQNYTNRDERFCIQEIFN